MAVKERDYMKQEGGSPEAASDSPLLNRINEFGERHAKIIITLSTALIILTVLVFAKYFYDQSQVERAELGLAEARGLEDFEKLRDEFGSTPLAPRILFRLAGQYYQDGQMGEATKTFEDLKTRFPQHPLTPLALNALELIEKNRNFESAELVAFRKSRELQTYPGNLAGIEDAKLRWGPERPLSPLVELKIGEETVEFELFEDEAPHAVAHFIKLCESNYFDGVKLGRVDGSERLETQRKEEGAVDYTLPYEETSRPADAYSLALIRKEGAEENVAGRFQILLRTLPALEGVTLFGTVTEAAGAKLASVDQDTPIASLKVTRKRDHPYEPKIIEKKK